MMKRYAVYVISLCACVGLWGCHSDSVDPVELPADYPVNCVDGVCSVLEHGQKDCHDGDHRCSANAFEACILGEWKKITDCPYGCSNHQCLPCTGDKCDMNSGECDEGAMRCAESAVEACVMGNWRKITDCPFGCENSMCLLTECKDDMPVHCDDSGQNLLSCDGGKLITQTCELGCEDGACLRECEDDALKCMDDGFGILTCENGVWKEKGQKCEYGCVGDQCVVHDCESGRRCSEDKMSTEMCTDGHWVPVPDSCEFGCVDGRCLTEPPCTDGAVRCSEDNANAEVCVNTVWEISEPCKYGCNDGSCIEPECLELGALACEKDAAYVCENYQWVDKGDPVQAGCQDCHPEESVVCEGDTTLKACDESGYWQFTLCDFGCSDGKCRECEDSGDLMCSEDGKNLRQCVDGFWQDVAQCGDFGCANGVCNECIGSETRCADDALTQLSCKDGHWKELKCTTACDGNTCVNVLQQECLETCETTCDRGICITDEMKNVKYGDSCDSSSFEEYCDGDEAVYCNPNGQVVRDSCSDKGGCSIVEDYGNAGTFYAFCRGDSDKCTQNREKHFYCTSDEAHGYYESYDECIRNTDDSFTLVNAASNHVIGVSDFMMEGNGALCKTASCDANHEHCAEPEKYYCDLDKQIMKYSCSGSDINGEQCEDGAFVSGRFTWLSMTRCALMGGPVRSCFILDGEPECKTVCGAPTSNEGVNPPYCKGGGPMYSTIYSYVETCAKDDNGSLYSISSESTYCKHNACADDGTCLKLVSNEGETCVDGYSACGADGDIIVTCVDGVISATRCSGEGDIAFYPVPYCMMVNGMAECIQDPVE